MGVIPYAGITFYTYESLKKLHTGTRPQPADVFAAATAVVVVVVVVVVCPLRFQINRLTHIS